MPAEEVLINNDADQIHKALLLKTKKKRTLHSGSGAQSNVIIRIEK